jgi:hypothetical protein
MKETNYCTRKNSLPIKQKIFDWLDEDDIFEVKETQKTGINIRLIGGQNEDSYTVENG